jgi:hypothetical protein
LEENLIKQKINYETEHPSNRMKASSILSNANIVTQKHTPIKLAKKWGRYKLSNHNWNWNSFLSHGRKIDSEKKE